MDLNGCKILVTGASGLVGGSLVPRLLQTGAQVRATFRNRTITDFDGQVETMAADLTDIHACQRAVEGMDIVIHCAAGSGGAASMTERPMAYVTSNIVMDSLLLDASYRAGIKKFLWLGSTTGYPPSGERLIREEEMFDGEPFEKYYFVGWAKRCTEILCRMYGEKLPKKMLTIVLRPTSIYGPGEDFDPATSHVIPALIRKVVERRDPLEVWGTGNDVRDVIYVDDVVDVILRALTSIDESVAINIGHGQACSVQEILNLLLELDCFPDANITFNASRPTTIPIRKVDLSRAANLLNFQAKVSLREGLAKTLAWYRQNR